MIYTTLNKIRAYHPCKDGWEQLLRHLGKTKADDEPLALLTILDSNGLYDLLWCLRTVMGHDREWRLFAVWCARQVQHLMTDLRSIEAIDVAERFANGTATSEELKAAVGAAEAAGAVIAAGAAVIAAWTAVWAARAARAEVWAAGEAAEAAGAAVIAAWTAAGEAAGEAAGAEARVVAESEIEAEIRRIIS